MFLLAVLVFSAGTTMGQRPENFTKIVTENIVESLNHNVQGVVEASIYNSLFLAKYYPDAKMDKVVKELNKIAVESTNPSLRYKAQLAVLYISNYGNEELKPQDYKQDHSELFREISEMMKSNLLASNQN
jgi:hypothetical protein